MNLDKNNSYKNAYAEEIMFLPFSSAGAAEAAIIKAKMPMNTINVLFILTYNATIASCLWKLSSGPSTSSRRVGYPELSMRLLNVAEAFKHSRTIERRQNHKNNTAIGFDVIDVLKTKGYQT